VKARFPLLLTLVVALAAPGAMAGEKDKDKPKDKDKKHDKASHGDHDGDHHDGDDGDHPGKGKITICHVPPGNASAKHTIRVSESAWKAHEKHGDNRGACPRRGDGHGNGNAFDRLDRNNNGVVSRAEWPHGDDAFRRLDRDDDGNLTREEYGRY
jgi:hypothetical protein